VFVCALKNVKYILLETEKQSFATLAVTKRIGQLKTCMLRFPQKILIIAENFKDFFGNFEVIVFVFDFSYQAWNNSNPDWDSSLETRLESILLDLDLDLDLGVLTASPFTSPFPDQ